MGKNVFNSKAETYPAILRGVFNHTEEVNTLSILLLLMEHYNITPAMLKRDYGLDPKSLKKVRGGGDLERAHDYYLRALIKEAVMIRQPNKRPLPEAEQFAMKALLYDIMLYELTGMKTAERQQL